MYTLAIILALVFSLLLVYLFILSLWIDKWIHGAILPNSEGNQCRVSIIVPFRNESAAFKKNINVLINQVNASDLVELIFVNDHSEDDSVRILEGYFSEKIRIVHATGYGKKNAVKEGVEAARFEYILTLDADIEVHKDWIFALLDMTKSAAEFIILPLEVKPNERSFGCLQAMEFLSLYAVTGATAMSGYPMMCNGAHLLFSKAYYEKNIDKLRFDISSGDDMFLMEAAKTDDEVVYANSPALIAQMDAEISLRTFIRQRVRWSGKTRHLKSWRTKAFGLLVVLLQMSFWLLILLALRFNALWYVVLFFFIVKSAFDIMLINAASSRTGRMFSLYYCVLLALIYPVYGLIIPVLGLLVRPSWKGRVIST